MSVKKIFHANRKTCTLLLKGFVSIFILAWLAYFLQWQELITILSGVKISWLLCSIVFIIASMVISVYKWQVVLQAQGMQFGYMELWRAYWVGLFFNNFLPSSIGGDAMRILWIASICGDTPGATNSVVIERILATAGMGMVGLLGAILVARPNSVVVFLYLALTVISGLLIIVVLGMPFLKWSRENANPVAHFFQRLSVHSCRLQGNWGKLLQVVLASIVFHISVVAIGFSIFRSLGLNISVIESIYVIPLTIAAAMVPIGVNGYGLREGAYIALLGGYGISSNGAFASSVMFAFLVSMCSLYGGGVFLMKNPRWGTSRHLCEKDSVEGQLVPKQGEY